MSFGLAPGHPPSMKWMQSCFYDLSAKLTMAGGAIAMISFVLTAVTVKIRHKID